MGRINNFPFNQIPLLLKIFPVGLAISDRIVADKHFGDLRDRCVRDRGTEFIIEIPMKQNSYRIHT